MGLREMLKKQGQRRARKRRKREEKDQKFYKDLHEKAKSQPFIGQ